MRILTVDDEQPIQELYEAVLGIAGFELAGQAFDGRSAVTMYAQCAPRPNLVVMDFRMPVLDGLLATREILRLDPGARIIFVSADGSVEGEARAAGAIGFLAKPFPLSEFIGLINGHASAGERHANAGVAESAFG